MARRRESCRTRIVATIGPACSSKARLRELVRAGVDVFRLNFSHGTADQHRQYVKDIRSISKELGTGVAILQDLPGPKLRVGAIDGSVARLRTGSKVTLCEGRRTGDAERLFVQTSGALRRVGVGKIVRLADGHIDLKVLSRRDGELLCRVLNGGTLRASQGLHLPGGTAGVRAFTRQDRAHLELGLELGVDAVAISFVRDAEDIRRVWKFTQARGARPFVIAKIERTEAMANLDEILDVCSGVMVARGDLGIELGVESVPLAQKRITRAALRRHRPVITATQMLESMIERPHPTRAEVSDIANAVLEGTDALMLSGETAVGRYPGSAVATLVRVARELEGAPSQSRLVDQRLDPAGGPERPAEATSRAARVAARSVQAEAMVAFTHSGRTVRLVSSQRPQRRLIGVTPNVDTWRRMRFFWGVEPMLVPRSKSVTEMIADAEQRMRENRKVRLGAMVVIVCGESVVSGGTNTMRIHRMGQFTSGRKTSKRTSATKSKSTKAKSTKAKPTKARSANTGSGRS